MTTVAIQKNSPWYTTEEITNYLKLSRRTLSKHMKYLNYGHHYILKFARNPRSTILWHVDHLEKYLCQPVGSAYKNKSA